jgi:DNA uptake protein ComE-like DNA-binding protein
MRKRAFALVGLVASLAAAPLLAQTPQTGSATTAKPTAAPAMPAASTARTTAEKPALVDINSASKEELEALVGIGPVRAESIIKGRPYKGKDELHRRKIIPMNVYEGVKDRIVARQS